jgi:RNA polymerase sigma-70 factor, ECF subfamily
MVADTAAASTDVEIRTLVRRGQAGDQSAFEELYLIHYDRIYSYLHFTVGNQHDAEDLTTQTFLKMLQSIERFRWGGAPFSAWLFRIAHNAAMDHFRTSRRLQLEGDVQEPVADESTSAEAGALASIRRKSLLKLIDELSADQQQVLALKFVFGFSNSEAAEIGGKTEGAVKSLQHRALVALHKKLEWSEAA